MSTTVNLHKVKTDIADLKSKKDTLVYVIQKDIDGIDSDILNRQAEIGLKVFEMHERGEHSTESLADDFNQIKDLKSAREAKFKKSVEISARYDEEIELLEKLIPEKVTLESAVPSLCPKCSSKYNKGVDSFCMSCGYKLN